MVNASWVSAESVDYYVIADQAKPFQIERQGEAHSGIITDIVNAVFKGSEYQLNYQTYPFNRMISLLESNQEDNWITYGSPKWSKAQSENLSDEPVYMVKHRLLSSSKKPLNYRNVSELHGKVVVLLLGFDYPELQPYLAQGEVEEMRVKNYQSAFRVINRHPGDLVFVEMKSRITYHLEQLSLDKTQYEEHDFSNVIPDYPIHLAFSPNMDEALQAYINQRIKTLKEEGVIDAIVNKYI
ncbi:amino acid ABC transporter (plasmid) [Vibrio coralliilyticus]|nr:amino acid ABC transporter [Vibrio coralliilyticus]